MRSMLFDVPYNINMLATDYEYFVIIIIIIMVIYLCIYFKFDVLFLILFYFTCDIFYIIRHPFLRSPGGCDGGIASDDGVASGGSVADDDSSDP